MSAAPVTGFTPGPWRAVSDPHREVGNHPDVQRFSVWSGKRPIMDGYVLLPEDAALIASAPQMAADLAALRASHAEMLAALKLAEAVLGETHANKIIRETLARAEALS